MRVLEEFLKPMQAGLFKMLRKMYKSKTYVSENNFILVCGQAPVMLVAHLDTVHSEPVRTICKSKDKNVLMSPQGIGGDDRCGVFALVKTYELVDKKPWLLFTCNEATGGLGANAFCKAHKNSKLPAELNALKFLVEIDRRGSRDAVYYDCDNLEFEKYIASKGFQTAFGSFSDISYVAPELGIAAVNLSSGYYNAHTLHEYIVRSELEHVIEKVCEMVADAVKDTCPKYAYVKKARDIGIYSDLSSSFYRANKVYSATPRHTFKKSTATDFEEVTPKKLSHKYEEIYDELLDFYTAEELEQYRAEYGDQILRQLYIDEYGAFYAAQDRRLI